MDQNFTVISPVEIDDNVFKLIGSDWMLISASDGTNVNTMTASWGTAGILWNKPVCICFIRPQRYTYEIAERTDRLSFSILDDSYRRSLQYCGSHSGRDGDKFAASGLTPAYAEDGTPYVAESRMVLLCRKLYADDLREGCFLDPSLLANYKAKDYHRFYVCEIEKILVRA